LKYPILITGAAGFVGSNLARYFVSQGIKIHIIIKKNSNLWRLKGVINKIHVHYSDLNNKTNIKRIIKKIKPKTIFHLATNGAYSDQNNLIKIKESIFDSTFNLINECKKYKFNIFVNTGSSSEYGFKKKKMKESDVLVPNSYYSAFKSSVSLYCQFESINSNIQIITVRPFHVYGPFERPTRLIPVLIKKMLSNKKISLVSPKISRDLIHIDDLIRFYVKIANKKNLIGEILNLGSGKRYTIKDIYNSLKKLTGYKKKNLWNTMKNRAWDQSIWYADMSYVRKKIKWKPRINLKNGLLKTVEWHKKYYNEK
jgi:nucleoside-diphosphate-sugar epimerase